MAEPELPPPRPAPPAQLVVAAGTAVVTAARVGRLLGRTGWRLARQLPGGEQVEHAASRLVHTAVDELHKRLDPGTASASAEEFRAIRLIQNTSPGDAPLRSAMGELLERAVESTSAGGREYLFGSIISQLVPDEARILAALAAGPPIAAVDVVARRRGRSTQTVLANASTVGRAAGVASPESVPTYLTRLDGYGLLAFGPPDDSLDAEYDRLDADAEVRSALGADSRRRSARRLVRKTVGLSALGREFWSASDPAAGRPAES